MAVAGFFYPADYAALRALLNRSNNKVAFIRATEEVFGWYAESLEADDAVTWFKPTGTAPIDPGRWKRWNLGGATRTLAVVADRTGLKGLAITDSLKMAVVLAPVEGMTRFYLALFGDVSAADDLTVIEPTDGSGRFVAWM